MTFLRPLIVNHLLKIIITIVQNNCSNNIGTRDWTVKTPVKNRIGISTRPLNGNNLNKSCSQSGKNGKYKPHFYYRKIGFHISNLLYNLVIIDSIGGSETLRSIILTLSETSVIN